MSICIRNIFLAVVGLLFLSSCARNPVTGKQEVMLMSTSQEIALGKESDPAIIAQFGLYEDQKIQNFINSKGQQMARISHLPDLPFNFRILDSPVVNAFAVPGGYVYFTRGIMAHFNNEAQFAGVLGHEIGHITARHSAKSYTKQTLAQVGLMAGMVASEKFRQFANEINQGVGLLFLKFSRDNESQSDELGVAYSTKVKYDANHMADFFQTLNRLQQQSGASIPDFLSTHPNPANRHTRVHQLAEAAQSGTNPSQYKVNRDSYLRMIDGMVYGEDPKQGYVENNKFYHPDLKFEFPVPNNWDLVNSPTQVQMSPSNGQALILFTLAQQQSLDAAAQALVSELNLQVLETTRPKVNGFNAIAMVSDIVQQNQQGASQALRLMTYLINYNGTIYVFHGVADKSAFNTYVNIFRNTMTAFKRLTDPSKINVLPKRIKIKSTKQTSTLKQALVTLGASNSELNKLAILNGMELSQQVQSGTLLKLIE